ncbi:VWA domain-containing protein [Kineococcus sp. SYSU DK006]|uniref:VWA domain-containing protein n=1 Tax=Kineococcus sp. SYSU DK006 TaxID=3383127 RepID=UPI003D7EDFDC
MFWRSIDLGRADYGVLERLDTLPGRPHDDTGSFALDDLDAVGDEELYERIPAEFPSWVRGYHPPGSPALQGLR